MPSAAPPGRREWDRVFAVIALIFALAALFHAAAFVRPEIAEPVPRWWHALFVGVNLGLAAGLRRRPRWFPVVFAVYVLQQVAEHAPRGIDVWQAEHRIDWASLASIVFVPIVLALLVADERRTSPERGVDALG